MIEKLPPPAFYKGIEQFNRQEFFECHETLEEIWLAEKGELRRLYQGILQVGVGFHHILKRKNYRGAVTLLQSGMDYLLPFRPVYFRVDLESLIAGSNRALDHIKELGPEKVFQFDTSFIPTINLI